MADKGWIKLHRQLQDCPLWYCERFSKGQAWVDLLLMTNHSDKKIVFNGQMMVVKRGQYLTSMLKLAEKWQWDRKTVKSFLSLLIKDNMISVETDNHRTLITIENYSVFQMSDDEELDNALDNTLDTEITNGTDTGLDTRTDTNKNIKNVKNINICSNEQLKTDFDVIYKSYPKKVGKTKGFEHYKAWVTNGRVISGVRHKLTNRQIWNAIAKYKHELESKDTELEFYKNFDTFMCKAILDYVEEE